MPQAPPTLVAVTLRVPAPTGTVFTVGGGESLVGTVSAFRIPGLSADRVGEIVAAEVLSGGEAMLVTYLVDEASSATYTKTRTDGARYSIVHDGPGAVLALEDKAQRP